MAPDPILPSTAPAAPHPGESDAPPAPEPDETEPSPTDIEAAHIDVRSPDAAAEVEEMIEEANE